MNLLAFTFVMDQDDPVLPHQALWMAELARHCTQLTVITEKAGRYPQLDNMKVITIPVRPFGIPKRFGSAWALNITLYPLLRREKFDAVFIHMTHMWTYRLWPLFHLFHLPVLFWYAHGSVSWHLRLALKAAQAAVTSTPESLRLTSPKISIIGHGINTDTFAIPAERAPLKEIIYIGRMSQRKRILEVIAAFDRLRAIDPASNWQLKLYGPTLTADDSAYLTQCTEDVRQRGLQDSVHFNGPIQHEQMPALYKTAAIHLSLSDTGSMDKTVLEALACGCPVLTNNPAFQTLLSNTPGQYTTTDTPEQIARGILDVLARNYQPAQLRKLVTDNHSLPHCIERITAILTDLISKQKAH